MTSPKVSVVILNWNGRKFLEQFLTSVISSTYANLEVIVADNASTDDSLQFLKKNYPNIRIIQNTENGGYAKGYNDALKLVDDAKYYVLLNTDVEVAPNWIEPIVELMETDEKIAACQPKILSYADKFKFEYAGAAGGWVDSLFYPFARGRVFDECEEDRGQYDNANECFWASGAAMFVRSDVFKELNGFDEYLFAHMEEIDLCWRAQLLGYKIYCQPKSVVYHVGGGTLPKGDSFKAYLNFRNNLVIMHKNLTGFEKFTKIPMRLLMDGIAAWRSLLMPDKIFNTVAKAHFAYMRWVLKGKTPKRNKKTKSIKGVYAGSIARAYFLSGKKTFSEIVKID